MPNFSLFFRFSVFRCDFFGWHAFTHPISITRRRHRRQYKIEIHTNSLMCSPERNHTHSFTHLTHTQTIWMFSRFVLHTRTMPIESFSLNCFWLVCVCVFVSFPKLWEIFIGKGVNGSSFAVLFGRRGELMTMHLFPLINLFQYVCKSYANAGCAHDNGSNGNCSD